MITTGNSALITRKLVVGRVEAREKLHSWWINFQSSPDQEGRFRNDAHIVSSHFSDCISRARCSRIKDRRSGENEEGNVVFLKIDASKK